MNIKASDTVLYRNTKCCDKDEASTMDIKKTFHADCNSSMPTSYSYKTKDNTVMKRSLNPNQVDTVFNCPDHGQQHPIRTKCYQYKNLLQRIRSLLGEIKAIRKNEATGMCEFCKRYNTTGRCKRCEILANRQGRRHKESVSKDEEARQQRYKIWLSKVKQFLYVVLEREVCQHKLYHDKSGGADELTNLLNELKSPLQIRELGIGYFPSMDSMSNLTESKDILEEVLFKLKTEKHYDLTAAACKVWGMPCPSTCKYFSGRKFEDHSEGDDDKFYAEAKTATDYKARTDGKTLAGAKLKADTKQKGNANLKTDRKTKDDAKIKDISDGKSPKKMDDGKGQKYNATDKEKLNAAEKDKIDPNKSDAKGKESKKETKAISNTGLGKSDGKGKSNAEEDTMIAKMLKSINARKEPTQKIAKPLKLPSLPMIEELPMPKRKEPKIVVEDVSDIIIECGLQLIEPTEMVKSTKIVSIDQRSHSDTGSVKPILFKVNPNFNIEDNRQIASSNNLHNFNTPTETNKMKKSDNKPELDTKPNKGIIKYSLSNREFIDKGWTLLPTTKIMRRVRFEVPVTRSCKLCKQTFKGRNIWI